jgi:hypothetical protein
VLSGYGIEVFGIRPQTENLWVLAVHTHRQVIEIMCDAAGLGTDRFHFLDLLQFGWGLKPLAFQTVEHGQEAFMSVFQGRIGLFLGGDIPMVADHKQRPAGIVSNDGKTVAKPQIRAVIMAHAIFGVLL